MDMPIGPTDLGSLIERHRAEILALVRRYRGHSIAVFGSVARGDAGPDSDVDFLVEFEPSSSLLDLVHLEEALTALLGVEVDVVSAGALLERDVDIRNDAVAL
jgi:predicted nucleotidyltransferase